MTFIKETIQENMDLWREYLTHPFITDIRKDAMDEGMFAHYLCEDTIYLKEYARVFAMGLYKSRTMEEMRLFFDLLKVVESDESVARVKLLKQIGINVEDIENNEPSIANRGYMNFLNATATNEGIVEILFATLPCMLSYAFIGQELLKENPHIIEENTYGEWIQEYVCESYLQKCRQWSAIAEAMCKHYDANQKIHLKELFHEASVHEMNFWDMSYQKVNIEDVIVSL